MAPDLSSQNIIRESNSGSKADGLEYICSHENANAPAKYSSRTYYSVGMNPKAGLKEKIQREHGRRSRQARFVRDFEEFLSDPEKYRQATRVFRGYIRHHMNHPQEPELVDELMNSSYIETLKRLSAPGSDKDMDYFEEYAKKHNISMPQAVLFGPNGAARLAVSIHQRSEMLRGQHKGNSRPVDKKRAQAYDDAAFNIRYFSEFKKEADDKFMEIADGQKKLPEGLESRLPHAFGRDKTFSQTNTYKGARRLPGDLAFQALEAMATELLIKQNRQSPVSSNLEAIIEEANQNRTDAFEALYRHPDIDNKALKSAWEDARKRYNDYAETLWRQRSSFSKTLLKNEVPGSIFLKGNRYYWSPKHGQAQIPLIPEKCKNKLPGCISKHTSGGYYWVMTHLKFRRKLVPDGLTTATKDLKTAQELQRKEWQQIQKYEPQLAERINKVKRMGAATKHRPTAVKIARKLWRQMQENDPDTVNQILSNKRPEISRPDIDAVWPSWQEEKKRLASAQNNPQLPIVYPQQSLQDEWRYGLRVPEKLETIVNKMENVNWIKNHSMLVFDDNAPYASSQIARQSRGENWPKQSRKNKSPVIQGSASLDKDNGRFCFTVYRPGYASKNTLSEEIYHVVFGVIKESQPKVLDSIQQWHKKRIDPSLNISEAFSQAMAEEESGHESSLPRTVVKHAQKIFSENSRISAETMEKVKGIW
ncbi:MAG: hypothetical protein JXR78_09355 [Victivallales bacterium]|nr:hypothetical protein [Victivallales bacterium]